MISAEVHRIFNVGPRFVDVLVRRQFLGRSNRDLVISSGFDYFFLHGNMDLFYEVNLLNNTQLEPIAKGKGA